MNIIVDLDNVLFYNDVVDKTCALNCIPRGIKHDLSDLPKNISEECFTQFQNPAIMGGFKPFIGAYKVIKTFLDMGHKVYIVTARDFLLESVTLAMIKRHLPEGVEVILVGSFKKYDVYKRLNADIVIDDHFDHILEAKIAEVPHVVMVSNSVTPYNHSNRECVKDMGGTIVNSLADFGDLFVKWQDHMDKIEYCNDVNMLLQEYDNEYECDYPEEEE